MEQNCHQIMYQGKHAQPPIYPLAWIEKDLKGTVKYSERQSNNFKMKMIMKIWKILVKELSELLQT